MRLLTVLGGQTYTGFFAGGLEGNDPGQDDGLL